MNFFHRRLCRSDRWRRVVEKDIVPWVLDGIDIGSNVLEVGPGPGVTADLLRRRVQHLTCVEIDSDFAQALVNRMAGGNVTIVCEDATSMSLADGAFDGAISLTMLHHVPSMALQNRLFSEIARVLRPGGLFAGVDSLYSVGLRLVHFFDTMVLVDPTTLPRRLEAAGFTDIHVDTKEHLFRFRARRHS
jgi:SAM-dependent methyltransferase